MMLGNFNRYLATGCLWGFVLLFAGCNPAVYKKPADDLKVATTTLKHAYFLEMELSNRARIERNNLDDQIDLWIGVPDDRFQKIVTRMTERRNSDLHADLNPLREKAFAVLEGYATTLASLAANEPTEEIVAELEGLVTDVEAVLQSAQQIEAVADAVAQFSGPLQQYVGVLKEVVRLVSSVLRERAISETVGRSNESVLALLKVLKEEAVAARDNVLKEVGDAHKTLGKFVDSEYFSAANTTLKAAVAERLVDLKAIEARMALDNIEGSFDAAVKAQGALVRKALSSEPGDWAMQIRTFREQVYATRLAIENVRTEMR